ncbi:MAG: preprotein translocase subunit SecG [Patescibacteria group bacterium]
MELLISISLIIVSALLVTTILLQQRGSGLGGAFGGDSSAYHTKRGPEKVIYIASIILSVVFMLLGVANILLNG